MRCSQPQGLSVGATEFIKNFDIEIIEEVKRKYPDGKYINLTRTVTETTLKIEPSDKTYGMFGELDLMKYTAPNGEVFVEFVQACEWSSGPMEFLAFKDADGKEIELSLWTKEELEANLGHDEYDDDEYDDNYDDSYDTTD